MRPELLLNGCKTKVRPGKGGGWGNAGCRLENFPLTIRCGKAFTPEMNHHLHEEKDICASDGRLFGRRGKNIVKF